MSTVYDSMSSLRCSMSAINDFLWNLYKMFDAYFNMLRPEYIENDFITKYDKQLEDCSQENILPSEKKHNNIVMVFDTETTGLIPKPEYGKSEVDLKDMPHIIQLSFIVWDIDTDYIIDSFNEYIKIPYHVKVADKITELTGITKTMCDTTGVSILDALEAFEIALEKCDVLVAHNISFDKQMIEIESKRASMLYNPGDFPLSDIGLFCKVNHKEMVCTMVDTIDICAIQQTSRYGKPYNKWPNLAELYNKLFNKTVKNMHNALIDVLVCLRCYLKYKHSADIDDGMFNEYIRDAIMGSEN